MSYHYQTVASFLSSSEHNRCRRNGLNIHEANEWCEIINMPWLTRKMRKKIGHLWNLNLLKNLPRKPLIGVGDMDFSIFNLPPFKGLDTELAKKYLDAEDDAIMKGLGR